MEKLKYYYKTTVTRNHLRLVYYPNGCIYGHDRKFKQTKFLQPVRSERSVSEVEAAREFSLRVSRTRTKNLIIDLANSNRFNKFITLTFKDNIVDHKFANYRLKLYVKALKYKYYDFKYLGIWEYQQRGSIHFHLLSYTQYDIDFAYSDSIWGQGSLAVTIQDISKRKIKNLGMYMAKYITKDIKLSTVLGLRRVFKSKDLFYPRVEKTAYRPDYLLYSLFLLDHRTSFNLYKGVIDYKYYYSPKLILLLKQTQNI